MHDITYLQILKCLSPSVIGQICAISTVRPKFVLFLLIFFLIFYFLIFTIMRIITIMSIMTIMRIITTWTRNSK